VAPYHPGSQPHTVTITKDNLRRIQKRPQPLVRVTQIHTKDIDVWNDFFAIVFDYTTDVLIKLRLGATCYCDSQ
jgi:hypothetical protein